MDGPTARASSGTRTFDPAVTGGIRSLRKVRVNYHADSTLRSGHFITGQRCSVGQINYAGGPGAERASGGIDGLGCTAIATCKLPGRHYYPRTTLPWRTAINVCSKR